MDKVMTLPCCQWIGAILTASALVAAILLIWAQQWVYVRTTIDEEKERQEQFRLCLGKSWLLFAIVLVFVGCAWAFWNCALQGQSAIGPWAIGCSMAAFFMTGLAIVHSLFIAVLGLFRLVEPDKPTIDFGMDWRDRLQWIAAMACAALGCLLTAPGLTGAVANLEWVGLPLVIGGGLYYAVKKLRSI